MFKIHVYTEEAKSLFVYESAILPMVGDKYASPDGTPNHYEVTKRLLHVGNHMTNIISIWVKES